MVKRSTADADSLAVGQPQTSADGLLHQRPGVGCPQRNDRVEIRHVPALLEHVDVDDDLGRVVPALDRQKLLDVLVLLLAPSIRVHLDDLALVPAARRRFVFDDLHANALAWVVSCATTSMNGFTIGLPLSAGVDLQLDLGVLVNSNAVLQLQLFQSASVVVAWRSKFSRVATAGSLTKPSSIAADSG